jgi:hypothetical protein
MDRRKARVIKAMLRYEVFTVKKACEIASVDPTCHYDWMRNDKAYAEAINDAIEAQVQRLEQSANERAIGIGIKAPSDLLTVFLLNAKRPAIYRPAVKGSVEGKDGQTITFSLSLGDAGGAS